MMVVMRKHLEIVIGLTDGRSIPVICGRCSRGWFVLLPEHDSGFSAAKLDDITEDSFKMYLDGMGCTAVAGAVQHALRLLMFCGGEAKWVLKRLKKRNS
jgi:hypothetical protein